MEEIVQIYGISKMTVLKRLKNCIKSWKVLT